MTVQHRVTPKTKIYQLKVTLRSVKPPVWRRLLVPGDVTLARLSDIVQSAMGWSNSHLHEFEIAGERYGQPDDEWGFGPAVKDEAKAKLFRLAAQGDKLRYSYDFGDGWEHDLLVEKVQAPELGARYPWCVTGRRACPPEDVGGPWGYEEFLAALADPDHESHAEMSEWAGGHFDPAEFDLEWVNTALAEYS
jgi:hypothetical protein